MRIGLLTTDTPHHRYFARRLCEAMPTGAELALIVLETRSYPWRRKALCHARANWLHPISAVVLNPYVQPSCYGERISAFEGRRFFSDGRDGYPEQVGVVSLHSVNDDLALAEIDRAALDLLLVYGTGRVKRQVFTRVRLGAINAHGGKLPGYRGLDTNLWAALHDKPEDMQVTWHQIDDDLDTGAVFCAAPVPITRDLNLYSLRYFTTLVCTSLCLDLIRDLVGGAIRSRPQGGARSDYYGPMPWLLKQRADRKLRALAARAT